jgi:acetyl esterase/lipase
MPLDDPTLSPINASMAGLTPVHLNVGARDLFLSDIRRLRDALHKRRRHRHLHRAVGRKHAYSQRIHTGEAQWTIPLRHARGEG